MKHRKCEKYDDGDLEDDDNGCEEHATYRVKDEMDNRFNLCTSHYLELIDPNHNGEKIKLVREY